MRKLNYRRRSGESGQSMVEFALVIPLLLLIILGIIQFGSIYQSYILIQNAAREGARMGSIGKSDAEISTTVNAYATGLDASRLTVAITPTEGERRAGDTVTVTVSYTVPVAVQLLQPLLGEEINLSSEVKMRL